MANRGTSNTFLQLLSEKKSFNDDSFPTRSHSRESGSSTQSRILDIERAERTERAALIQRAERLCASQKAHSNAVLERLGFSVQHDTLPSARPPAPLRWNPESSQQGGRIRPILKVEERNSVWKAKTNQIWDEEDPFFEKKVRLGSQMAMLGCKMAKLMPSPEPPISPVDSLNSVDTHTPSELRAISHLGNFSPSPPPTAAPRRPSRLPVWSRQLGGAGKELADGCKLQSARFKVKGLMEEVDQFKQAHLGSQQPQAAPRRVPALTPMAPSPPSTAAPLKTRGPRRGTNLRPSQAGKNLCPPKAVKRTAQEDFQPLDNPFASLSLCFDQLHSEDWEKKLDGFKSVRALVRHHPQLLLTKLHEFCLVLSEEVANLRSVVACAAMDSIADLHVYLGRAMDPEAERTGRALLLKLAQTSNAFIHQQAKLALDALVEGCSPSRTLCTLLYAGLNHPCVAVRASTAQHLQKLASIVGEDQTLTAGKTFAERFLTAVSKMSVDAATEVRFYGQKMLQVLAHQTEFIALWNKLIPVKDRRPLNKILRKMRQ